MSDDDFLWPQPGHTFFEFRKTRPDADSWMHRTVGEYALMYQDSAEKLMDLACDAPGILNVHALPAVFLFRHYVELSLKDMLLMARPLNDAPRGFPDGHPLLPLWTELRALMAEANIGDPSEEPTLDVVEAMIIELDQSDPNSMSFRYPVGRESQGRPLLLDKQFEYFDMRCFREQAKRLAAFIDGCGTQLEEYLGYKRDMEE